MFTRRLTSVIATMILSSALSAAEPAPLRNQAVFEVRFLTEMIDHHAMAVMMADLCLERAVHPELLETCHQIRETQMEEIATMQLWLEEWYGIAHEPQMTPGMSQQMEMLASLTGADFEIEFMKGMIRHHWMAVVKAMHCQDLAYHAELLELCEAIETMQLEEIELMGSWLCAWYDICNYHGSTAH